MQSVQSVPSARHPGKTPSGCARNVIKASFRDKYSRREASSGKTRFQLIEILHRLLQAIRTAHLAAEERLAAYRTAQSAVEQAEENLRIRRQQFDAGRAQSDDVLIAENLLSQQRATLATALYQAHVRKAELQRLIGLPIATE